MSRIGIWDQLGARILAVLILAWPSVAGAAGEEAIRIEQAPVRVETRRFNPERPPADMPPLTGNEAAVTRSNFSASTQVRVIVKDEQKSASGCTSTVVIEQVEMKLGLQITIWLPTDANRKLIEHEKAHQRISERFYKDARMIAQELARPFIGRTLHASGPECDLAVDAAIKKAIGELGGQYMNAVEHPASRAQIIFDEITHHGANDVDDDKAIEQAVERVEQEQRTKEAKR